MNQRKQEVLYESCRGAFGGTPEFLVRFITVTEVKLELSIHSEHEPGQQPGHGSTAQIQITGTMDEPVRTTREVEIVLYSAEDPKPVAGQNIGLIHGITPMMRPTIFLPRREFDYVWTLPVSGLLKHASITPTPPRYLSADVLNIGFSTHSEDNSR